MEALVTICKHCLYAVDKKHQVVEEHLDRNGQQHNTEKLACYIYATLTEDALQDVHIAQHQVYDNDVEQQTYKDIDQSIH